MWLWRVFESAFVRKLAYVLAGLLLAMVVHKVRAQSCTMYVSTNAYRSGCAGPYSTLSAVEACENDWQGNVNWGPGGTSTVTSTSGSCESTPTSSSTTCDVNQSACTSSGSCYGQNFAAVPTAESGSTCPVNGCGTSGRLAKIFGQGTAGSAGSSICGSDGCSYTQTGTGSNGMIVNCGGGPCWLAYGLSTGTTCSAGPTQVQPPPAPGQPDSLCVKSTGGVACITTDADGNTGGQVNNDALNPLNVVPGGCALYSDGSSACEPASGASAVTSPPAPDNGTPGTPASAAAVYTAAGGRSENYYTAAATGNSASAVAGQGSVSGGAVGGTGSGASGVGSGSGSCTVASGASVAVCDCTAGPECNDAASGGSDCSAPPACVGDTVSCNEDMQEWKARCPDLSETASSLGAALAGDGSPSAIWSSSVDISSALSTTNGPFGSSSGATCPAPLSVTVMGQSLSFDLFSKLCDFATTFQYVVLFVGWAIAGRIMLGAVATRGV